MVDSDDDYDNNSISSSESDSDSDKEEEELDENEQQIDDEIIDVDVANSQEDSEEDSDEDDDEANSDEDSDDEDEDQKNKIGGKKTIKKELKENIIYHDSEEEDSDDNEEYEDENYLQKFNSELNKNYIVNLHPECVMNNYDEIITLSKVVRDEKNNIIDDLHKTIPYLTKYEKARILGQRAKQINSGAKVFVPVPENILDGYLIAEMELKEKKIPFIIRRPLSHGGCEYWSVKDLEIISF
jgi:DNA-directed RNA polymerase subunit K/omega